MGALDLCMCHGVWRAGQEMNERSLPASVVVQTQERPYRLPFTRGGGTGHEGEPGDRARSQGGTGLSECSSTHRHPRLCAQERGCCYMIMIDQGQSAQAAFANWCGMNCVDYKIWEGVHQFLFRTFYEKNHNFQRVYLSLIYGIRSSRSGSNCIKEC
jgi:hypothetical protein